MIFLQLSNHFLNELVDQFIAIGKAVLRICEEHNYLPFLRFPLCDHFYSKMLYAPKFESDLVGNSEERSFRDNVFHRKSESCNAMDSCTFMVLRNSNIRARATTLCGRVKGFSLSPPVHKAFQSSLNVCI